MKQILITDKNPYIRQLILRELAEPGRITSIVDNIKNLLKILSKNESPHIIILDPEILPFKPFIFIENIILKAPKAIIIVHGFSEWKDLIKNSNRLTFIEKNGTSLSDVKSFINSVLNV